MAIIRTVQKEKKTLSLSICCEILTDMFFIQDKANTAMGRELVHSL